MTNALFASIVEMLRNCLNIEVNQNNIILSFEKQLNAMF